MASPNLYAKLTKPAGAIQCQACIRYCTIPEGGRGFCGVRENSSGKLALTVENKALACHLDPIEKKPLFHFLPSTAVYSFGTFGCNLGCLFCQNYDMSQTPRELDKESYETLLASIPELKPQEIVKKCVKAKIPTIAYTYNEPTIFIEYALKTAKLAKNEGIKNVLVSNGCFSDECFEAFRSSIDAINIDLKSFSDDFYQNICGIRINPKIKLDLKNLPKKYQHYRELSQILKNIQQCHASGIWTEVTTLIIPDENDSDKELTQIAEFLVSISPEIPWHISAFYPAWKMLNHLPTPARTLERAYKIGQKAGLKFIYTGNISAGKEDTLCPKCKQLIIARSNYTILENNLKNGKCPACGESISGIWNIGLRTQD